MKFFEVKSPYYYALIAAKNEEECAELYEQVVTDIENREEFIRCLHELNRNEAIQEDAKKLVKKRYNQSVWRKLQKTFLQLLMNKNLVY
ncbi:hypothetical protein O3Q48_00600 [Enterococcus lactis]|nr:hypothetical protein [Enterococcus faecium]MCC9083837.1 hypothetical protein [Enterococcus faecium]MCC9086967.1 hypothetical protein [Enterococcus faecium]MCF7547109.1 hypothetical protein [Enterococcus faecium]MCO7397006.1 hypothetical protein [Enterococcus lactis]